MSGGQALSLPTGGGVGGLGGGFTPDLHTGGGGYGVPLDLPPGPDGLTPKLTLQYSTGHPTGPFGLGWSLPLPTVEVDTTRGAPRHDGTDRLVLPGAGVLQPLPAGGPGDRVRWVPRTDGTGWRVLGGRDGFEVTERSGLRHTLGTTPAARVAHPDDPTRVAAWLVEASTTPTGGRIAYRWLDGDLVEVAWAGYVLRLVHETAPVPRLDARCGWLRVGARRCTRLELHVLDEAPATLVRSWTLGRTTTDHGHDLLTSVTLTGHAADGTTTALPPLRLTYGQQAPGAQAHGAGAGLTELPGHVAAALLDGADLADIGGDGLTDVADLRRGRCTVLRNRGGLRFDPPTRPAGAHAPGLLAQRLVAVDLTGRGRVDLVAADAPFGHRYPLEGDGRLGRPVVRRGTPGLDPVAAASRLGDTDGDRTVDVLQVRGGLLTVARHGADGWATTRARAVAAGPLAEVDTADPALRVAPMKGDALPDLVQVRPGRVTWWPCLGGGRWGAPRVMAGSPVLPVGHRPDRVFVVDVDGDGCADLVHLDDDRVRVWFNRAGHGYSAPVEVPGVPGRLVTRVETADLTGTGVTGLVLVARQGARARAWYLAPCGPGGHLLTQVDGPFGERVRITYGTAAAEQARARDAGRPWAEPLPLHVPVVTATATRRHGLGAEQVARHTYRDGRWDPALQRFLGFAEVETLVEADDAADAVLTVSRFHTGRAPGREGAAAGDDEAAAAGALLGRLVRSEVRDGADGALLLVAEQDWTAHLHRPAPGVVVAVPRLVQRRELHHDGAATPWRRTVTTTTAWDAHDRPTTTVQRDELTGAAGPPPAPGPHGVPATPASALVREVRTETVHATGEATWVLDRPARVTQTAADGTVLSWRTVRYDGPAFEGLPEGQVTAGLVSAEERLVLDDATAALVAAAATDATAPAPTLGSLGLHRRDDVPGWFVHHVRLGREDLHGPDPQLVSLDPFGAAVRTWFDARRLAPVRTVDARGNTTRATADPRAVRTTSLVGPDGGVHRTVYDALGRAVAELRPGDADDDPALRHRVVVDGAVPYVETVSSPGPAHDGGAAQPSVVRRAYLDADGTVLLRCTLDGDAWVVDDCELRTGRGLLHRAVAPFRAAPGADPGEVLAALCAGPVTRPVPGLVPGPVAEQVHRYDALGRPVRLVHEDGSVLTARHLPGRAERTGAGGRTEVFHLDASGRTVHQQVPSAHGVLTTTVAYDAQGRPVEVTDPVGRTARLVRDLEGRTLLVTHPHQGRTLTLHDAAGGMRHRQDATGQVQETVYDVLHRPVLVHEPGTGRVPVRLHYLDADDPEAVARPADVGRLHRVEDALGTTVLRHDAHGHVAERTVTTPDGARHVLRRATDRLGRVTAVGTPTLPGQSPVPDTGYSYDARGLLVAVQGVLDRVVHDAAGCATAVHHTGGVVTTADYDTARRPVRRTVHGPDGTVLDSWALTRDAAGRVAGVTTRAASTSWTYVHDDLDQLVHATTHDGQVLDFAYGPGGDLLHRAGVGDLVYGEDGADAGLLTSAGALRWRYDAAGRATLTPDGAAGYDTQGRLVRLATPDGTVLEFAHGAGGAPAVRRAGRPGGPTSTTYVLDEATEVGAGQLTRYVVVQGRRIAETRPGGEVLHLHHDHRGSTVLVTGAGGAVRQRFVHDPFGLLLQAEVSGPAGPVVHRFDGYRVLDGAGLMLADGRPYDPRAGRFCTPDPVVPDLWHPVSLNRYAYAGNSPGTVADPSGRAWWHVALAALAVVAVVVLTVVTFGAGLITLGAMVGVFSAMAVGGAVGGIAAAQAGGGVEQVLLGVFVGAALAGAASLGGALAGAGFAAAFGAKALVTHLLTGAVGGALLGAATGFAAGWAGGAGAAGDIWRRTWQGALAGFVTGLAMGLATYGFQQGWFGTGRLQVHGPARPLGRAAEEAAAHAARSLGQAANTGAVTGAHVASAAGAAAGSFAQNFFTFGGQSGLPVLEVLVFNPVAQTLVVGAVSSLFALDLADDLVDLLRRREASASASGSF